MMFGRHPATAGRVANKPEDGYLFSSSFEDITTFSIAFPIPYILQKSKVWG